MGHFFIIMITIILTSSEGVPHMATNDDEYNGYYIPKGQLWSVMGGQYEQSVLPSVLT